MLRIVSQQFSIEPEYPQVGSKLSLKETDIEKQHQLFITRDLKFVHVLSELAIGVNEDTMDLELQEYKAFEPKQKFIDQGCSIINSFYDQVIAVELDGHLVLKDEIRDDETQQFSIALQQ